jgi:hypothetical protein
MRKQSHSRLGAILGASTAIGGMILAAPCSGACHGCCGCAGSAAAIVILLYCRFWPGAVSIGTKRALGPWRPAEPQGR